MDEYTLGEGVSRIEEKVSEDREKGPETGADYQVFHQDVERLHEETSKIQKRNLYISAILIFILSLVVIFSIWFFAGSKVTHLRGIRIAAARYNLLKPSGEYMLMKERIKEIERGLRSKMLMYGKEYSQKRRLTDSEFDDYITPVYIGKILDGLNVDLFIANTAGESQFNKKACSSEKAKGINQIMPYTFRWINQHVLFKFKKYDIYDVFDNTEASVKYWIFNKRLLESRLDRKSKPIERAWAYNCGADPVIKAVISGNFKEYLPRETITHGKKVIFYYTNYNKGIHAVWWDEQYHLEKKKK
jgi:hypothetical protein